MILELPWGDSAASSIALQFDSVSQKTWIQKKGSQTDQEAQIYRQCFSDRLLAYEQGVLQLQFIKGPSLARAQIPIEFISGIFLSIVDDLNVLHQCGYIHQDLKPDNILLNEVGQAKLIDFGFAVPIGFEAISNPAGNLKYASPEQKGCRVLRESSDIYALGLILQEKIIAVESKVPRAWLLLIEGMLEPDVAMRMDLEEVAERLELIPSQEFIADPKNDFLSQKLEAAWMDHQKSLPWAQWFFFEFPDSPKALEALQSSAIPSATPSKRILWGSWGLVAITFSIIVWWFTFANAGIGVTKLTPKQTVLPSQKIMIMADKYCSKIWLDNKRQMGTTLLLQKNKKYNVKCLTLQKDIVFYIINTDSREADWILDETRSKK